MPMKHHEISNAESLSLPIWALEDPYDPIDSFRLTDMYVYIYIYTVYMPTWAFGVTESSD